MGIGVGVRVAHVTPQLPGQTSGQKNVSSLRHGGVAHGVGVRVAQIVPHPPGHVSGHAKTSPSAQSGGVHIGVGVGVGPRTVTGYGGDTTLRRKKHTVPHAHSVS